MLHYILTCASDSGNLERMDVPYSWTSKAARRSTRSSRGPIDSCHRDTFFAKSVDSMYSCKTKVHQLVNVVNNLRNMNRNQMLIT